MGETHCQRRLGQGEWGCQVKVMIARYAGKCITCHAPIKPGQSIKFFGRGSAAHYDCGQEDKPERDEDEQAGLEPGTLANDRRLATRGLSVTRFSSGAVVTRCGCIDWPCCGC